MKTRTAATPAGERPKVSAGMLSVFAAYNRRYLRRRFHSFRVLREAPAPQVGSRPLVFFLNHSSWWDPLICLALSQIFYKTRASFGPIDAAMLERYSFFKRLGFYGVEPNSLRGTRQFLRTTRAILSSSNHAVWITPQGKFMDVRERPLRLQAGLGALAIENPHAAFVPLAIEYPFWTEPRPEILVAFGEPIIPREEADRDTAAWTHTFAEALEATQDDLAARSCRRDPADWQMLDKGAAGISAVYDVWRRLKAKWRGERFVAEHREEVSR